MGQQGKSRKVVRADDHRPYGGDEYVDLRTGISTENHMEMYGRLIKNGPRMHGTPDKKKKKS